MKRILVTGSGLIFIGVLILFLFKYDFSGGLKQDGSQANTSIAEVESVQGLATLKDSQDQISMLTSQSKIFQNYTLSTDQNATLRFQLSSGAKFEMAPLTKLVFETLSRQDGANISITILEGQIQLISNSSNTHSFEVSKKGKIISLEELKTNILKAKPSLPEPSQIQSTEAPQASTPEKVPDKASTNMKKTAQNANSLDQEEINRVMRNQTSFLHRCYINYMLRSQRLDLSGQVVLSFMIQPTGKVTGPKVISSPIQDEQLDRCLTDVIGRASFKEFSSRAILVQAYPIHLD